MINPGPSSRRAPAGALVLVGAAAGVAALGAFALGRRALRRALIRRLWAGPAVVQDRRGETPLLTFAPEGGGGDRPDRP